MSLYLLPHKPSNTSFVDVTLVGDSVNLSNWHYPVFPSLSDHPFISFRLAYSRAPSSHTEERLPQSQFCDIPFFLSTLEESLVDILSPDSITAISSTCDIDDFIVSLNEIIKSSVLKSKVPFHPSKAPSKMPWWSVNL